MSCQREPKEGIWFGSCLDLKERRWYGPEADRVAAKQMDIRPQEHRKFREIMNHGFPWFRKSMETTHPVPSFLRCHSVTEMQVHVANTH